MEGRIEIKGFCYEDVVSILTQNGYDVQVTAKATNFAANNIYIIDYKKHIFELPWD